MNQTVKRIVDILFQDTVENEETQALHEELMHNCQEHYQDLIDRGLSEDEAIGEVVESLKGMKDVIAEYPRKTHEVAEGEAEKGGEWVLDGVDTLRAETTDQDLYVSPSGDGRIRVYCDDPEGLTCSQDGNAVTIRGALKRNKVASSFGKGEGEEEITLSGILNMVGNAIRNVTASFQAGAPIRIEVPDGKMRKIDLNTRSGDVACSCAVARETAIRSTSGDVTLDPVEEKTAESLLVSTVSGDADVHGSAMDAEVSSMSGDVTVDGVFENLRIKSTSGDARFSGTAADISAVSVSGDVDIRIENRTLRKAEGKSTSGDVEITLPEGIRDVHAECSTTTGECLSRISDAGSGATVQVRAKSVSGDVTIQ